MDFSIISKMAFQAIGGLGIFLLGMRYLSEGIQTVAGPQLRGLISSVTDNRVTAIIVGLTFTCLVQSSSITTVMVVGLVNSAVMTLSQAIGVIMGANIGTTITGWILVLKIGKYGLPMLGLAAFFFLFSKNERVKFVAMAVMGIGMVFFGLELMKNGFKPIRKIPEFTEWFTLFDAGTYFGIIKCALVGCILTFLVQSSSATLGITIGLASTGVIGFESAAALVLGENIGTTITAWLASLGTSTMAKRAAYAHVVFNVLGVIWIIAIFPVYIALIKSLAGGDPGAMVMSNGVETFPFVVKGIAMVHTGFNVTNTLLFLPFAGYLAKLLTKLIPDSLTLEKKRVTRLDDALLETPAVGIVSARHEIIEMGKMSAAMMDALKEAVGESPVNRAKADKIFEMEEALDKVQNEVSIFLTALLSTGHSHDITEEGRQQLRMADEYESISDYIEKILKLHLRLQEANLEFQKEDKEVLATLHDEIFDYIDMVNESCRSNNSNILTKADPLSETITHKIRKIRKEYVERLSVTRKEPAVTMIFTDMINDYRRVKDHALNIAEAVAGVK